MKNIAPTVTFISLIFIFGCSGNDKKTNAPQELKYFDLTKKMEEKPFNLSEVYKDVKMIRLETKDVCLLKSFSGFVGDKYIIAFEQEKILLFNANGKFLKVIATEGKGPDEYTYIDAWDVDDTEQNVYLHDRNKNYIKKYNLQKLSFENDIPFTAKGHLTDLLSINDTTLAVVSRGLAKYDYYFCYLNENGKILGGNSRIPEKLLSETYLFKESSLKESPDHNLYFMPFDSDTLYKVNDPVLNPLYVFHVKEAKKSGNTKKGVNAEFSYIESKRIYISLIDVYFEQNPNYSFFTYTNTRYLTYDFETEKINWLSPIYANIEGVKFSIKDIAFGENNRISFQFTAIELKEKIEERLKDNDISEQDKERLKQFNKGISEYDNPIIFAINTDNQIN